MLRSGISTLFASTMLAPPFDECTKRSAKELPQYSKWFFHQSYESQAYLFFLYPRTLLALLHFQTSTSVSALLRITWSVP